MATLSEKISKLEKTVKKLESKIKDFSKNVEDKSMTPYSTVGGSKDRSQIRPTDISTGLGSVMGGNLLWNDSEFQFPPYGTQPDEPTEGYNKHGHSRYAGGALDIHTLELVEYETNESGQLIDANGNPINKHSQQFWQVPPRIAKDGTVEKIGNLDITFDSSLKKWIAGGGLIDVENTYLVQYIWKKNGVEVPSNTEDATKEIKKDNQGNEMKAPLLFTTGTEEENLEKSTIMWDEEKSCWRFYAVFKPYIEGEI